MYHTRQLEHAFPGAVPFRNYHPDSIRQHGVVYSPLRRSFLLPAPSHTISFETLEMFVTNVLPTIEPDSQEEVRKLALSLVQDTSRE